MKKLAVLLSESLLDLKDASGINPYCVHVLSGSQIKVVPNPDSSRSIICSVALARIIALVDSASKYFFLLPTVLPILYPF